MKPSERACKKALDSLAQSAISGEVIVADNGSTDGSIEIAESLGARVVRSTGPWLRKRLDRRNRAARGRYVIMGDADDSYDFRRRPEVRGQTRQGLRPRARLPAAFGGRHRASWRDALAAPMARQPHALAHGPAHVQDTDPGYLLRHARLYARRVRPSGSPVHRNGVRHRNGHQGQPLQRAHRSDPDHIVPGRQAAPPPPPENFPGRLANAPVLPDLLAAVAVLVQRMGVDGPRSHRLRDRAARFDDCRRQVRRAHAGRRQRGLSVRSSERDLRGLDDNCTQSNKASDRRTSGSIVSSSSSRWNVG